MAKRTSLRFLPDGREVQAISIGASDTLQVELLTLGATIGRLEVTCGDGQRRNVVTGHASPGERWAARVYMGTSMGRFVNRIAGGRFTVDGVTYQAPQNDAGNTLHGGDDGFDRRMWELLDASEDAATLALTSPDGDMGFPGELRVTARFSVRHDTLAVHYEATTSAPTPVNLSTHPYFNLAGDGSGSIGAHELQVHGGHFMPVDPNGLPCGVAHPVTDTPFDLRAGRVLADVVGSDHPQIVLRRGLDHNFVIDGEGMRPCAVLSCAQTRTALTIVSNQPGLQVYTGGHFDGTTASAEGVAYEPGHAIALEAQNFPDAVNHPE